ncbi:MAG TPA: DMT family transporter [Gemmatimonadaceae bacterium]|jgi:drug/metabolite transporter (DMT)-like permease
MPDSTAGGAVTPGCATSKRPGVWLTEASLVLMAVIWAVNFSVVKYGTSLVDPLAYNGIRVGLAATVLMVIVALSGTPLPPRKDLLALLGLGVLGNGFYQCLFVIGVSKTSASDAALVIAATPAFVAIVGKLRGSERTTAKRAAGIALSILGMGFVVLGATTGAEGAASLMGDLIMLAASLCWAFYTVLLKPYTARIPGMQLSAITMVGGAVPLVAYCLPAMLHTDWTTYPRLGWAAVAYSGLGSLVIAYAFWYRGIRVIGPTRTAMYSNLQPVVAVLVAWQMLGEVPTLMQGLGAGSIMAGLLLSRT